MPSLNAAPASQAPSPRATVPRRLIRVLMIDDNALALSGLERYMSRGHDISVVGTATDPRTGLLKAAATRPDVILLDLDMPGYDTIAAIREIVNLRTAAADMAVVIFSGYCGTAEIGRCLEAGASGYICKEEPTSALVDLIRRAAGGEVVFSPMAARAFLGESC